MPSGTLSPTIVMAAVDGFWRPDASHVSAQPASAQAPSPSLPPRQWYYYAPPRPDFTMPGPPDAMPQHILTSLGMLQSQFTAFQESLGAVSTDVKDALSQLHALRTAQNKSDKSIAELEGVVGVGTRGRARRGRGRGRGGKAETPLHVDSADPERTLIQSMAAIEAMLARPSHSREWHRLGANRRSI